jgi:uncharacterized PurR-regulated membrane protein YhhQ (DUF165 family)
MAKMTSQLIDSVVFIGIAFWGTVPYLGQMILGQYVVKVVIAPLDTPLFYALTSERSRHGHSWHAKDAT